MAASRVSLNSTPISPAFVGESFMENAERPVRTVLACLVIVNPVHMGLAKSSLLDTLLCGLQTGYRIVFLGDGSDTKGFQSLVLDASSPASFQAVVDTLHDVTSIVPNALSGSRVCDSLAHALTLCESHVDWTRNGCHVDVVLGCDITAAQTPPKNFGLLSRRMSAANPDAISVHIVSFCDHEYSDGSLIAALASLPLVGVLGGADPNEFGDGFVDVKEILDTPLPANEDAGVCAAPTLTSQPTASLAVGPGSLLALTVAATGFPHPSFQWYKDSEPIPGAVASRLVFPTATLHDSGQYTCMVRNDHGTITSKPSTVTVTKDVFGVLIACYEDLSEGVRAGNSVRLTANVTQAVGPCSFQWLKDGKPLLRGTSGTYVVAAITESGVGAYSCKVTCGPQTVTSTPVLVTLAAEPPLIDWHTCSKEVTIGKSETLKVHVLSMSEPQYQWYFNGALLDGETNDALHVPVVEARHCGVYVCKVWNDGGSVKTPPIEIFPSPVSLSAAPVGKASTAKKSLSSSLKFFSSKPALSPRDVSGSPLPISPVQASVPDRSNRVRQMTARSRSVDADAMAQTSRLMSTSVPIGRGQMPADRIKALEATIEDLRNLVREREAKIKRQEDELKYRARRCMELEKQVSVAGSGAPASPREFAVTIGQRSLVTNASARSPLAVSSPATPSTTPKSPPVSMVTSALNKLKSAVKTASPRSRSLETPGQHGTNKAYTVWIAPVPAGAPMETRMLDAAARVAALQQLVRERDAEIAKLQDNLKYRARKMNDQDKTIAALQTQVEELSQQVVRLQRTLRK